MLAQLSECQVVACVLCYLQGLSKGQADRGAERWTTLKPFAGFAVSSFMGQSWLFWFMAACFPGIQVINPASHSYLITRLGNVKLFYRACACRNRLCMEGRRACQ